jgi:mono/diheme cytochrome c family protein
MFLRAVRFALAAVILASCAAALNAQVAARPSNPEVFTQRILPSLKGACASCHMTGKSGGGLSLDTFDNLLAGGKHGPAISPGDAKQSLLIQYLRGEKSPRMPMGGVLPDDVIASLAKAIDLMEPPSTAAKRQNPHLDWLLHKPVAPPVPEIKDAGWIKNPIDAFILAKLHSVSISGTGTTALDIDIPSVVLTGTIKINGTSVTSTTDAGELFLKNAAGDGVNLGDTSSGSYSVRVVPGTYDIYYQGAMPGATAPRNQSAKLSMNLCPGANC